MRKKLGLFTAHINKIRDKTENTSSVCTDKLNKKTSTRLYNVRQKHNVIRDISLKSDRENPLKGNYNRGKRAENSTKHNAEEEKKISTKKRKYQYLGILSKAKQEKRN